MQESEAGFLEHLEDLRKRLLTALAAIGIFSVAGFFFSKPLFNLLTLPLRQVQGNPLYFQAPYEAFLTQLSVSVLAGAVLASPVLFTQLWLFLAPGLYHREKRALFPLILISILLFLVGGAFSFWVLVPTGLKFFLSYQTESLRPLLGVGPYFSFLAGMILAGGLVFDLPVVVLGLVRAGVLNQERLKRSRKAVVVTLLVLAAVLTPTPDPVSQLILTVPLVILFEACIFLARWVERKK